MWASLMFLKQRTRPRSCGVRKDFMCRCFMGFNCILDIEFFDQGVRSRHFWVCYSGCLQARGRVLNALEVATAASMLWGRGRDLIGIRCPAIMPPFVSFSLALFITSKHNWRITAFWSRFTYSFFMFGNRNHACLTCFSLSGTQFCKCGLNLSYL